MNYAERIGESDNSSKKIKPEKKTNRKLTKCVLCAAGDNTCTKFTGPSFNTIPHNYNEATFFRNFFIFPKSTHKWSVSQHTGKLPTFSYSEDILPIDDPKVCNYTPIMGCHIPLQGHYPVYLQSYSLPLSQFYFNAWAVPRARGALIESSPLAQLRKKNNCSRCLQWTIVQINL